MNSIKPAVRNRGRTISHLLLSGLFLFISLSSNTAFSASLAVTINQINPNGAPQQVTCAAKQKCVLPIDIQTGTTKETLNISLQFLPGVLMAEFQTPKGYLYAGNQWLDNKSNYETLWRRALTQGTTSTGNVTLYLPVVPNATQAPILDAARETAKNIAHPAVATLTLSTQLLP